MYFMFRSSNVRQGRLVFTETEKDITMTQYEFLKKIRQQ